MRLEYKGYVDSCQRIFVGQEICLQIFDMSSTYQQTLLIDLPTELLIFIAENLRSEKEWYSGHHRRGDFVHDYQSLRSLSLVSRRLCEIAQSVLFQDVNFRKDHWHERKCMLLRTILEKPRLGQYVK